MIVGQGGKDGHAGLVCRSRKATVPAGTGGSDGMYVVVALSSKTSLSLLIWRGVMLCTGVTFQSTQA